MLFEIFFEPRRVIYPVLPRFGSKIWFFCSEHWPNRHIFSTFSDLLIFLIFGPQKGHFTPFYPAWGQFFSFFQKSENVKVAVYQKFGEKCNFFRISFFGKVKILTFLDILWKFLGDSMTGSGLTIGFT